MWFSSRIRWAEAQAGTNVAFKYARVMKKGTKEIRVGGGLQWTVEERLDEYLHFVAQKVDSACKIELQCSLFEAQIEGEGLGCKDGPVFISEAGTCLAKSMLDQLCFQPTLLVENKTVYELSYLAKIHQLYVCRLSISDFRNMLLCSYRMMIGRSI